MFNREQEANRKGGDTIIAPGVKVEGDFVSDGNVIIEGEVNGSVKAAGHLEVGEAAKIKASVTVGTANVAGEIIGNLTVKGRLELSASSHLEGDVEAEVLLVAAGAKLNGRVTMNQKQLSE
jgi:cytoskeletal protein CcmA (bactofilin family)